MIPNAGSDREDGLGPTWPLVAAAVLGGLAVALGAFGAHGLQAALADAVDGAKRLEWWQKGAHYHLVHAAVLLGVGLLARLRPSAAKSAQTAAVLVIAGVVFFSGSLYVMTLTNLRVLGAITPIGGLAFIAGWVMLAIAARR